MAKITSKASLVQNTNLFLHIADFGGSDIALADAGGGSWTLTSTAEIADWGATSGPDANGIYNRGLVVGDEITLSHMGNAANEGITGTVTTVASNVLTFNNASSTPVAESNSANINVLATKKTYQFVEAGGLDFQDGVQGIILHSKLVDMWDTLDLDKYFKPFASIEPRAKSMANVYGWEPHDQDTIDAIRDTALEIRNLPTDSAHKIYALWRSGDLHNVGDRQTTGDQFYFWPSSDAAMDPPTAAVMKGSINQLFLIYDAAGADNRFSNGVTWFTRCAEPLKTIVMEEHQVDYAEIMPVSAANALDPKLTVSDASGAPYNDVDYTNNTLVQSHLVDGVSHDFDAVVDANVDNTNANETNEVVHNRINWMLRQSTDINSGDGGQMRGDKQWPITSFTGDIFTVQGYLNDFNAAQRNNLRVVDDGGITRQWPSILTLIITAGSLAVGGTFSIYHKSSYGTSAAVLFQNESDVNQQDIAITGSDSIVMAYSTYNVDGHTPNTPLDIVIAYNRPGFIEPDTVEATLDGSNLTVALPLTADPSYTAA